MHRVAGVLEVARTDDKLEVVIIHPDLKPDVSGVGRLVLQRGAPIQRVGLPDNRGIRDRLCKCESRHRFLHLYRPSDGCKLSMQLSSSLSAHANPDWPKRTTHCSFASPCRHQICSLARETKHSVPAERPLIQIWHQLMPSLLHS